MAKSTYPAHPDDLVVWPDLTVATVGDVRRGDYGWMSDDYEIVSLENEARIRELGLDPREG
ncbi:MAG: hypothetical protein DI537_10625 [Stutzerimonas stutzeri]|nr:MAG: hypothetical protein DI537_10625 [Stutzerimonas stutzeri]